MSVTEILMEDTARAHGRACNLTDVSHGQNMAENMLPQAENKNTEAKPTAKNGEPKAG